MNRTNAAGIPLIWAEPSPHNERTDAVIWLPGFSGTKESVAPQLEKLADEGFYALSFDPYHHGERRIESQEKLIERVIGNIRRHFWPILAHSAENVPAVIDWAADTLGISGSFMIGGISMGGDIAVAAAGLDRRITAAAACIATPDWLRPGSHESPGVPDEAATACYQRFNPLTNLDRYRHCPALSFQCGALDTQVPPDGANLFVSMLKEDYRACPDRLEVIKQEGIAHRFTAEMFKGCIDWFNHYGSH